LLFISPISLALVFYFIFLSKEIIFDYIPYVHSIGNPKSIKTHFNSL